MTPHLDPFGERALVPRSSKAAPPTRLVPLQCLQRHGMALFGDLGRDPIYDIQCPVIHMSVPALGVQTRYGARAPLAPALTHGHRRYKDLEKHPL
jgi:hypothetical protein